MLAIVTRASGAAAGLFRAYPWIGWACWLVFVAAVLVRMHPRRFAPTLQFYLDYAARLWNHEPVYLLHTLEGIIYWPSSLLLFVPLTGFDPVVAGWIAFSIFAGIFTWGMWALMRELLGDTKDVLLLTGIVLLINIPACWYHFKHVQLHIIMTGAMLLAAAALVRHRWAATALWLAVALMAKLLALVMVLLVGALAPRTRLILLAGLVAGLALPFAFLSFDYMAEQYRLFGLKLWMVSTAPPLEWPYQADYTTLLRGLGIVLPGPVSFAIRLLAALGTLVLAWQVQRTGGSKAFALGVLLLSGLYITLFGPRNENVSFMVLTPALSILALLMLLRDQADVRGWLLVAACVVLGFVVSPPVDAVTKPAVTAAIYAWTAWQMAVPERWRRLVEDPVPGIP